MMKVKCNKIYNEHTKNYQETSSWLTIGKEYVVLEIEVRQDKVSFLVPSDSNQQPVLQNAIQFEVLNKKIPNNWQIGPATLAIFVISPRAWQEPGFWENCYDHDPKTLEIYKREARIIYEE
jgi:hypothetical protein